MYECSVRPQQHDHVYCYLYRNEYIHQQEQAAAAAAAVVPLLEIKIKYSQWGSTRFASVTVKPIKIIMKRPLARGDFDWEGWQGRMKENENLISCPSGVVIKNHKLIVVVNVYLYGCVASVPLSL